MKSPRTIRRESQRYGNGVLVACFIVPWVLGAVCMWILLGD